MLGLLAAKISCLDSSTNCNGAEEQELSPLESLGRLFSFYFGSRSALQKSCASYVVAEWASIVKVL
jgi:hypothetical protein